MIHWSGLVMLAQLHLERGRSTKKRKRRLVSLLQSVFIIPGHYRLVAIAICYQQLITVSI